MRAMLAILCFVSAAGCSVSSAVSSGQNTALDSVDLKQMTSRMAMSIGGSPAVQEALAGHGPLKIVVQPVENRLTGEVLPQGQAEAYTARVRYLLSQQAPERFVWVMNRDEFHRIRQREWDPGVKDLGPSPDLVQPEYALQARFSSMSDESSKRRTAAYFCFYELVNLNDRRVLWQDKYEVQKTAVKGFLD